MAVLPVLKYGDPILRKKVNTVTEFSNLEPLIEDMFDTLYEEEGIGLAANQVGHNLNLMVFDISHLEEYENLEPMVLINSEITDSTGEIEMEEGCLSIPEIRAAVIRPELINLSFKDENGHEKTGKFSGMISRVIQHEVDHLNGKFFTDYLSPAKRKLIHSRLLEIAKTGRPSTGVIV